MVHRRAVDPGDTLVKQAAGDAPAVRQTIILDGVTASEERIIVAGATACAETVRPVTPETAKSVNSSEDRSYA